MAEEAEVTKLGRKSKYTEALGELICEQIASGQTLKSICSEKGMPSERTVHYWLTDKDKIAFLQSYNKSKLVQYDVLFDEIIDISNDDINDTPTKVNRARIKIDARKLYVRTLNPAKYGDKPEPVVVTKNRNYDNITNEQLRQLIEIEKLLEGTSDK